MLDDNCDKCDTCDVMNAITIQEIAGICAEAGRPFSRTGLLRHLDTLGISPIGARQRPQRYPADTADKVLAHLGLTNGANGKNHNNGRILTTAQIMRKAGKKGRK